MFKPFYCQWPSLLPFDFYSINDKLITSAFANKWVITRVLTREHRLLSPEVDVLRPRVRDAPYESRRRAHSVRSVWKL